jgi:hypothetical protein
MSQGERLKKVINSLLESPKSFSDGIGLPSATTIYDVLSDKREITPALLKKIIDTYPNLDPDWLLTGKGNMFTWQEKQSEGEKLEDGGKIYNSKCPECREKDQEIEKLKTDIIELQRQIIEQLKKTSG